VGSSADFGDDADPMEVQKWTEVIVGAKIHAEQKGNMPAGLGEAIDKLTESRVNWKDYLKTSATRVFGRARYTYNKRNRRGFAMKIRLPGHEPDGKCAVLGVDTSASMSVEEVIQCITEGSEILRVCGCRKIWLILHDMRVYFSGYVTESDLTKLKMARGGTSHSEVFACLNRTHPTAEFNVPKEEEVSLAVLFTDLGTNFPDHAPDYEVLWGVPTDGCPGMAASVPFGKKVPVEMKKEKAE
jgi:predicted metal-dependent peptidase